MVKRIDKFANPKEFKLHICCGDVYLDGYINCDIDGLLAVNCTPEQIAINKTTIDKYFKYDFNVDASKRFRRPFIIDKKFNVMEKFPFSNRTIDEVVSISAFEHFEHHTELPHLISEIRRVLKVGGIWKFDFPNLKEIVNLYHDTNPEFCAEQIYCNHKNKYSVHQWGYTPASIPLYLNPDQWSLEFKDVVKHDYPMTGCWATKL